MKQTHKKSAPHPRYHHKPYHPHHLGLGGAALFLLLVSVLLLALFYTRDAAAPPTSKEDTAQQSSIRSIASDNGFSLTVDTSLFDAAYAESSDPADTELIRIDDTVESSFSYLELTPKSGTVSATARASKLGVLYDSSTTPIDASAAQTLISRGDVEFNLVDESTKTIGGTEYNQWVFRLNDSSSSEGADIYSLVWSRSTEDSGTLTIKLQGLIGSPDVPAAYSDVLDTLVFDSGNTLGLNVFGQMQQFAVSSQSDQQYITDLVSPAVVKIYHIFCGRLQLSGANETFDQCRAVTGSGFYISQDGLIATNGHVVVYEPQDALVDALVGNPRTVAPLLSPLIDINAEQLERLRTQPELLARTVSEIYSLPDGAVTYEEENEALLVSLGSRPIVPESDEDLEALFSFRNTRDIKNATLLAYDYTGEDQLNLVSGNAAGFTKSDVAILQIPMQNAPLIAMAQPADIRQGQAIAILGFPSDAENQLVDTSELVVSTTYGAISSIRTAAGGSGRLFQTDTDASQGNSGGPAINQDSQAVGLLTYRFKDDTTQNAAKSYIRDIDDVRSLLSNENITLDVNSGVQFAWREGLAAYSRSRFSEALPYFETIASEYPQHRLVDAYIQASEQNIAAGLDRTRPPIQLYAGIGIGLALLALAARLMVTHHGNHREYREAGHGKFGPLGTLHHPSA